MPHHDGKTLREAARYAEATQRIEGEANALTLPGAALVAGLSFFIVQATGGHHGAIAMREAG